MYNLLFFPSFSSSLPQTHLFLLILVCSFFSLPPAQKCDDFTDLDLNNAIIGTSLRVRLLLYTSANPACGSLLSHTNLSAHPQFNLSRKTSFIIHGYRPTGSPPVWLNNITQLTLARTGGNVIVVDWNHGAANINYLKAVENTHKTAENLTAFIKQMQVRDYLIIL